MTHLVEIIDASEKVRSIGYVHSSGLTAHEPAVINSRAVIPLNTTDASERNAIVYSGLVRGPKATGAAWGFGDPVYWDASAKKFTKTAASNTLCGNAAEARVSGDTVGMVEFNSFAVIDTDT